VEKRRVFGDVSKVDLGFRGHIDEEDRGAPLVELGDLGEHSLEHAPAGFGAPFRFGLGQLADRVGIEPQPDGCSAAVEVERRQRPFSLAAPDVPP